MSKHMQGSSALAVRLGVLGAAVALGSLAAGPAAGQCTPVWSDEFGYAGIPSGSGLAAATWPGGPEGPGVYVGGEFTRIGGIPYSGPGTGAGSIARWDGVKWNSLSGGVSGGARRINALVGHTAASGAALASGLYATGNFLVPGNNIARWDGTQWHPLGGGLAATFGALLGPQIATGFKLLVHDVDGPGPAEPALLVSGQFNLLNWGDSLVFATGGVGLWNGSFWSSPVSLTNVDSMGGTTAGQNFALSAVDEDGAGPAFPVLYIGGSFNRVNGAPIDGLARFNGTNWTAVPGISGLVLDIATVYEAGQPVIYVAGNVALDSGATDVPLARRRNGVWEALPIQGTIAGTDGTYVYLNVSGNPASGLARLSTTGDTLEYISPALNGEAAESTNVRAILPVDWDFGGPQGQKVLAAGVMSGIGATVSSGIALISGTMAEPIVSGPGPGGLNGNFATSADVIDLDGPGPGRPALLLGGVQWAGGVPTRGVARYDGATFSSLTTEVYLDFNGFPVRSVPSSIVAGTINGTYSVFAAAGARGVLRWNGTEFAPFASADYNVEKLAIFNDGGGAKLFAFGRFTQIAGQAITGLARYDGTSWTPATAGFPGTLADIVINDVEVATLGSSTRLFLACGVTYPSTPTSYFLEWTGSGWVQAATGQLGPVDFIVNDMAMFNGSLYLSGAVYTVNGLPSRGLARFDGSAWFPVTSVAGSAAVTTGLGVHDDGTGPALYIGGRYTSIAGVPALGLAKYDGTTFSAVPGITQINDPEHIVSFNDGTGPSLYLLGGFVDFVDGKQSWGIARLKTPCPTCPADFNNSGTRDVADIFAFLSAWFANGPGADFNNSGTRDVADIFAFLSAWFAGCP